MFEALEKRAGILCIGILAATVIVGKMFGGALKGLIPLGMCLSSGVWLWMKEVVRSGREVEWHSEQTRGQIVCIFADSLNLTNIQIGYFKPAPRISRVDEHSARNRLGIDQPRHVHWSCRHLGRRYASICT